MLLEDELLEDELLPEEELLLAPEALRDAEDLLPEELLCVEPDPDGLLPSRPVGLCVAMYSISPSKT